MDKLLDIVLEGLEREREQDRSPRCLPETALEALINDTLPAPEVEASQAHLAECLRCVHAYASNRRLLELARPESPEEQIPSPTRDRRAWRRAVEFCLRVFARPVPAGWAVGGAVAVLVLTWMIASHPRSDGLRVSSGSNVPSEMIGLAHRPNATPATIAGVVDAVRDATAHGVEAHIVTLKDSAGASYVLFAWGPPTVRQRQSVEVRAIFVPAGKPGTPMIYQGIVQEFVRGGSR